MELDTKYKIGDVLFKHPQTSFYKKRYTIESIHSKLDTVYYEIKSTDKPFETTSSIYNKEYVEKYFRTREEIRDEKINTINEI